MSVFRGVVIWRDARELPPPGVVAQATAAAELEREAQAGLTPVELNQLRFVRWTLQVEDQMILDRASENWVASWQPLPGIRVVAVSLWIPLFVFAIPTALLWYRARRRYAPGHCQHCGYDLTGNVSGRCSECGAGV